MGRAQARLVGRAQARLVGRAQVRLRGWWDAGPGEAGERRAQAQGWVAVHLLDLIHEARVGEKARRARTALDVLRGLRLR